MLVFKERWLTREVGQAWGAAKCERLPFVGRDRLILPAL